MRVRIRAGDDAPVDLKSIIHNHLLTGEHEEAARMSRDLMLVGIYAGLRLASEALTLRWADVDLRRGLVTAQGAYPKSGETRTVDLNAPLKAALTAHRDRSVGDVVFARGDGSPYRSIRTTFAMACRRAGLKT